MRVKEECATWVVYELTLHGKASGMNAVCEDWEWEAMQLVEPGRHTLVRDGISNEGEAEQLARAGSMGPAVEKAAGRKMPPR